MRTSEHIHALIESINSVGAEKRIKTYSDFDLYCLERARKMPIPCNGGYGQALLGQLLANGVLGPVQSLTANTNVPSPQGLIGMGSGAAITVTVPAAPISGTDDGKLACFTTDTAHAHVVSFTGATLLSVGVGKTTSTSGGLVGEFLLILSRLANYIVLASAGQTFA